MVEDPNSAYLGLRYYLGKVDIFLKERPIGTAQSKVLKLIAVNGYLSGPDLRRKLSNVDRMSSTNIKKLLRRLSDRQFIKEKKVVPNTRHRDYYELTQVGLHCILRNGLVENLSGLLELYPRNAVFAVFFDPFFSRQTIFSANATLGRLFQTRYFPVICQAIEQTYMVIKDEKEPLSDGNLKLITRNVIAEIVNTELIRMTFLTNEEAISVLAKDDIFFEHLSFIKEKLFDPRYKTFTKLRNNGLASGTIA